MSSWVWWIIYLFSTRLPQLDYQAHDNTAQKTGAHFYAQQGMATEISEQDALLLFAKLQLPEQKLK